MHERIKALKSSAYALDEVLLIQRKGMQVIAQVAGYVDSLDDTKPLYVRLRVSGGLRWSQATIKIDPCHIVQRLPNWQQEQDEEWKASIREAANTAYARMSPAQKEQLAQRTQHRRNRSSIEIAIDRACGLDS
jgi:hypothetical protein